jgi:ATP-dependent exoDNAse (exonuclease V) beta subunit
MRLKELERKELLLEQRAMQLDREHALLDWIESQIDLIEADLPAPSSAACWWRLEAAKAVHINNPGFTWVLGECSLCPVNAHRL